MILISLVFWGIFLLGMITLFSAYGRDKAYCFYMMGGGAILGSLCYHSDHFGGNIFIGVICIIIGFVINASYDAKVSDPNYRQRIRSEIEREYDEAVASQNATEPWAIRYSTESCPYCGHFKVRNAKWEDKQMSVAFWGVASSAIGKQYKCEHCNMMW